MSVAELAYMMAQREMEAKIALQELSIQSTGTAFIIGVTATNARQQIDQAATKEQQRVDILEAQRREQAIQATAAENKIITATAAAKTQVIAEITLSAIPTSAALTATKIAGQIVVDANNVEASNLDTEKKRDTNKISWQIPIALAMCFTLLLSLWIWRTSRWNVILDGNGEFQGYGFNDRFVKPALLTGPVLEMGKREVSVPVVADPETQKEVVINNQRIEALKALSEVSPVSGFQSYQSLFNQAPQGEFDVINAETIPAGMGDEDISSLDNDWNEKVNNGQ